MQAINFAKVRDAFLVASGIAYVAGYVVWAIVAWRSNLGPLPVIEGQYFAAGLPIILLICGSMLAIYLSIWGGKAVGELTQSSLPEQHRSLVAMILSISLTLVALTILGLIMYLLKTTTPTPFILMNALAFYLLSLMVFGSAHGVKISIERRRRMTSSSLTMFLHIVAFFISITLISLFIREVYPRIPQALGGAKPQCGQLDLRTSDFSEETLTALGANSSQDVVRTRELEIFFQSSSTVIVGIPQGDLFEIDRGGLAAIKVC